MGEDIYDCVPCEDEGDDIYEDIIKVEVQQPMVRSLADGRREESDSFSPSLLEMAPLEVGSGLGWGGRPWTFFSLDSPSKSSLGRQSSCSVPSPHLLIHPYC